MNLKFLKKFKLELKSNQQLKSAFICTMICDSYSPLCIFLCVSQFQRKEMCLGRSPPSFTSGLWNSRPARE